MTIKKTIIIFLYFYILALLQTSFLIHFKIEIIPNLILISVIFLNLFESASKKSGIFAAVVGGFFLDIFSPGPLGFQISILVILAVFIKTILKRYVQIPIIKKI